VTTFVDTSALYALLDADDRRHADAARAFPALLEGEELLTHNYVLVEAAALVQARLGAAATRALLDDLAPALHVVWVDEHLHRAAVAAVLAAPRRKVSLVDLTSFEVMRRRALETAFAFDRDFAAAGFRTRP
jgi:uncharacterized protein